jgi:hypothetical protein
MVKIDKMSFRIAFILFLSPCLCLFGQEKKQLITGKVSFVTSKNTYIKFKSTEHIQVGDTLKFLNQTSSCLVVTNKSSNSVVCLTINDCVIKKGDEVYYNYFENGKKSIVKKNLVKKEKTVQKKKKKEPEIKSIQRIRGRLSAASYSTLSSYREDRHRIMYRFSLNADHLFESKFSLETYLVYRQYLNSGTSNSSNRENIFNLYNLAVKYDIDPTFSVVFGRKINNKISSVGAIDGLQIEKYFGKNYVGAIVGFRPDIFDYSFNSDLLQYGAYLGRITDHINFNSQTTLGFIEQKNNSFTDRRYLYFQHSSTIMKKLYIFSSVELDIYNKVDENVTNDIRLTNLYVSARYRFNRKIDLTLSYDSRKRIIYYETFKTEIERILDDDIARQGARIRVNLKPVKHFRIGGSYSKRFQSDQQNKSDNLYGYATYSKLPGIGGSVTVNYNNNKSNYLTSNIASVNYSRYFLKNKVNTVFYYRYSDFNYFSSSIDPYKQNYYGTSLSINITRKFMLGLSGEYSKSKQEDNYRIYTKIIKRF